MTAFYGCLIISTIYFRTAKDDMDYIFAACWLVLAFINLFI